MTPQQPNTVKGEPMKQVASKEVCWVVNCDRVVGSSGARGICSMHYKRLWRASKPNKQVHTYGPTKKCYKCKLTKPRSEFHNDRTRGDGHASSCKACNKAFIRERYNWRVLQEQRNKQPQKEAARKVVRKLIVSGKLVKTPCFICNSTPVHGHHIDYDYPEKVIWLCVKHHREAHHGV